MPLKRSDAAQYLKDKWDIRSSVASLCKQGCDGSGPVFQRVGHYAIYQEGELDRWAQSYKLPKQSSRNTAVASLRNNGFLYREIAAKFGISSERVRQICAREARIVREHGANQTLTPMQQFLERKIA